MSRPTLRDCEGPHDFAVMIEVALKSQQWWEEGTHEISPPDGETDPDNFGVVENGDLVFIVRVEPW